VDVLYDDWSGPARVLAVGVLAYAALVLILRVSGKRTLGKMNAFDLVVTVALGSTLATILLSSDVSLAEGVTALALLIGLQYAVAHLQMRSDRFQALVKATPALLVHRGRVLRAAARRERVSDAELLQALRQHGVGRLEDAQAVVLETDGSLTVLGEAPPADGALANVRGAADPADERDRERHTASP
jgi:uncharacterized membrane protein YcaP (DUF421 family)